MAIKNSIVGVFGMLVSVVAGAVLDFIQKNGNQIFGIHLYGQQFLAGLSLCLTLIAVGYARHIPKREKTENV